MIRAKALPILIPRHPPDTLPALVAVYAPPFSSAKSGMARNPDQEVEFGLPEVALLPAVGDDHQDGGTLPYLQRNL